MRRRAVSIVGAGSLRCAPVVFASLAALRLEHPLEVRLYDANEERLDLMDRLARHMFGQTMSRHDVLYRPALEEAMELSEAVVVCLTEDCARRMTGKTAARFLIPTEEGEVTKVSELSRGDFNRPTPITEISPRTLAALSTPQDYESSREEALAQAMQSVIDLAGDAQVLNLTRNCPIPSGRDHTYLAWPEPLTAEQHASLPHRILRWLGGDHDVNDFIEAHAQSPVAKWFVKDFGAL